MRFPEIRRLVLRIRLSTRQVAISHNPGSAQVGSIPKKHLPEPQQKVD